MAPNRPDVECIDILIEDDRMGESPSTLEMEVGRRLPETRKRWEMTGEETSTGWLTGCQL